MKKLFFALVLSAISFSSQAETLRCVFTEPFFNITYNTETKVTTYTGVELYNEETGEFDSVVLSEGTRFVSTDSNPGVKGSEYALVSDEGKEILKLKLTFEGSDGMSDYVFPFDAWYGDFWGACETDSAPAINTFEVIELLN
jgi:hypothetical protein